jgi:rhodanese-related sulfurtransferase
VVLQCAGGYRSAIAASILAHYGLNEIADLVGGLAAWEEAGLDLVAPVST